MFNFLIIGGGATGASVALTLSSNDYSVLLIDKNDFTFGTSSKSTKLIHGGLRYLKGGQFKLVHKTGKERKTLKKHAPNLIHSSRMLIPVTKNSEFNKCTLKLGLAIYDRFTKVDKKERHRMLSASEAILVEPKLNETTLKGAALYTEYRCDDARLVISMLKSAKEHGATLKNYHEIKSIERLIGKSTFKVTIVNLIDHNEIQLETKVIINATGPWCDLFRKSVNSHIKPKLILSKGIHIVVPYKKIPLNQNVYFNHSDGRMIFVIKRLNKIYIGTTDTPYFDIPENAIADKSDVEYLLGAVNDFFSGLKLQIKDIESCWSGIRPLIMDTSKANTSSIARKDEVFEDEPGIVTIAGGKLTGCLSMAMDVATYLKRKNFIDQKIKPLETDYTFSSCEFKSDMEIEDYLEQQIGESKQVGGTPFEIERLVKTYGRQTEHIVDLAYQLWPEFIDKSIVLLCAEILFTIQNEWVKTFSDFWIRRTGNLYFKRPEILYEFEKTKEWFAKQLKLNNNDALKQEYEFLREYDLTNVSNFK